MVADGTTLAITSDVITFDTTAEAFSYALPDGVVGQKIRLVMIVDGGNNAVITPAHLGNGSTLTFADVGDACDLEFLGEDWWVVGNGVSNSLKTYVRFVLVGEFLPRLSHEG